MSIYKVIFIICSLLLIFHNYTIANNTPPGITKDRFESFNRLVYKSNAKVDKYILRPVAVGYSHIPFPFRYAIGNFLNNLSTVVFLGNYILQLNGKQVMGNIMRFGINSTFGVFGLIDVASSLNLPSAPTTFGDTLRIYGWKNSSYLMLPILGPSTVRDSIGRIPDIVANPSWWLLPDRYSIGVYVVNVVNTRANLLVTDNILNTSLDPYSTLRDIYLGQRNEVIKLNNDSESGATINIDTILDDDNKESSISESIMTINESESADV
jgi:phospholipid-binding lipoprotein MlaA